MNSIEPKPYHNDPRSFFAYLGAARAKLIALQYTERGLCLLDIVLETKLDDGHAAELLIRLETPENEMEELRSKLAAAIEKPIPHPWHDDVFHKAVTGLTPMELLKQMVSKHE